MPRALLALVIASLIAAPGLIVAPGVALAQPAAPLVQRWDSGQLVDVLNTLRSKEVRVNSIDGRPAIVAVTRDGLNVGLYAKGCEASVGASEPVCHAIEGVITFDVSQRPDKASLPGDLDHDYAMGKFTLETDGSLRASRYFLLDGGITQDNLRTELNDFFAVGALTRHTLWPQSSPQ